MSHPSIQQPSSMVCSSSTRSKMKQNMTWAAPNALADTLEGPKAPGERWCWEEYVVYGQLQHCWVLWGLMELCSIPSIRPTIFLVYLAVAIAGLGMTFATTTVQVSSFEAQSDHLRQPRSHSKLDFQPAYRNIDPEIYLPLSQSLNISGDLPMPTMETLTQDIQNRQSSAQQLATFINHNLPCTLRGLATGDNDAKLRLILSHGHKLATYDRTSSATLQYWYDASSPYYHRALEDAETTRDKARMSSYQELCRAHGPIPKFLFFEDAWRTQKNAQTWFDEVSSVVANHEADREALIADRDRNENVAHELFMLRRSLDKDPPGPWNRTDALALERWYFHKIVGLGVRKSEWAVFEADFDGLECDPVWKTYLVRHGSHGQ